VSVMPCRDSAQRSINSSPFISSPVTIAADFWENLMRDRFRRYP
jgi:hypothetical protein